MSSIPLEKLLSERSTYVSEPPENLCPYLKNPDLFDPLAYLSGDQAHPNPVIRWLTDKSSSCIGLGVVLKNSGISPSIATPAKNIRERDGNSDSHLGIEDRFKGLNDRSTV
ncbi:hypothetical protein Patl1_16292 [Pistacia atlantica]|uniref:Uncharacterized protein n=1 Tax=Pistacia atlantica TaxID=434234 RepID=A0ACC1B893_9ROSI|nr:hypothetical protein Patl1_16292 [Pistacia atlantica]